MSSLTSLRAGIIGTGFIGPVHLEALRRLGIPVTALCDLPGRAPVLAEKFGIPRAFDDFRDLVRAPEVDVVHVCSPNRHHYAMAQAALRAGKHVVCEKPLALNTRQTGALVRLAHRTGKVLAVNYNVRFYPAVLQLRRWVAEGALGPVIHVHGSYFQDWLFKDTDYNWRLLPAEGGRLRAVADIGTHWMDTAAFVLGAKIRRVLADLGTYHKTRRRPLGEVQTFTRAAADQPYQSYAVKTEDFAHVLLEFDSGARGCLAVSQVAAGRKNCIRLEVYGARQSAWWCSEDPEVLHLGHRDEANQTAVRATPAFGDGAAGFMDYPPGHVEGFPDTFKMLFRAIYGHLAGGGQGTGLFATAADGHAEVAVCEAVLASHKSRTWVRVRA